MALLSPAALEQLNKPHHIYYSKLKLISGTVIFAGFTIFFLWGGSAVHSKMGTSATDIGIIGLGVVMLLLLVFRLLPLWLGLGSPAITISKEGLRFRREAFIAWSDIEENTWTEGQSLHLTFFHAATIHLRAHGRKRKIQATFLKCDGDEYLHYCGLYQGASQQSQAKFMPKNQDFHTEHVIENPWADNENAWIDNENAWTDETPLAFPWSAPRCFPWTAFAWIIAAGLVVAAAIGIYLWQSFPFPLSMNLRICAVVAALGLLLMAGKRFPVASAWLFGPRAFILESADFRLDARSIVYQDITYLRWNYGYAYLEIGLRDGDRIRLRWSIWAMSESWVALLVDRTAKRMLTEAAQKLQRGEDLVFSKDITLNQQEIKTRNYAIPIRDIAFMGEMAGTDIEDADYRVLRAGTPRKTIEINLDDTKNPHVLKALLRAFIDPDEDRVHN